MFIASLPILAPSPQASPSTQAHSHPRPLLRGHHINFTALARLQASGPSRLLKGPHYPQKSFPQNSLSTQLGSPGKLVSELGKFGEGQWRESRRDQYFPSPAAWTVKVLRSEKAFVASVGY